MEKAIKELLSTEIEHPARRTEFSDLVKGLFDEVSNGNINVNYHPEFLHLAIFKYSQDCVVNKNWNKFTLMARGLILDLQNKAVVATPWPKFFNRGEIEGIDCGLEIDEYSTITEKVDGSLISLFFFEGKFRFATAGSFVSDQAKWSEKWAIENMPLEKIDKTNTYLFEAIYPENKVVVNYDFSGLVLLSIFNSYGVEYTYEQNLLESQYMNVRCVKQYKFKDINSILDMAKTLSINEEGYVIRFKNGYRLKIKGDTYLCVHRAMSKITPLTIWEEMINDNLIELETSLPEEIQKDFNTIVCILESKLKEFIQEVEKLFEKSKEFTNNKDLSLHMKKYPNYLKSKKFETASKYIFLIRNGTFYSALNKPSSPVRRRIFTTFKPKSNYLEGYKPSLFASMFTNNN